MTFYAKPYDFDEAVAAFKAAHDDSLSAKYKVEFPHYMTNRRERTIYISRLPKFNICRKYYCYIYNLCWVQNMRYFVQSPLYDSCIGSARYYNCKYKQIKIFIRYRDMHFEFVCKDTLIDGSFPYAELCANNRIFLSHFKSNYKYFHGAQICIL